VIGPDDFRKVLSHFGSGVTIVTTSDTDKRPTGLTCSSFASVSLDPPLILVCVDHKAQSFNALRDAERFAVNILSTAQEAVSRRFATSKITDKFEGVPHAVSDLGLPLLHESLAHLECTTVSKHVEGDHTIFVGRVERISVPGGEPLLYFKGRYERLAGSGA
jgi:flavin reductase (DIM6/NTAB) family NADH-FMN oxidoreductase RutF